jgi:hypothetical protein
MCSILLGRMGSILFIGQMRVVPGMLNSGKVYQRTYREKGYIQI